MSRNAIVSAIFGALAAAVMVVPANAAPASAANLRFTDAAASVQTVGHHRGYQRGHNQGVRLFFGSRRHGNGWANNNNGWRGNHGRRNQHGNGYGSGYGRGNGGGHGRSH